MFNNKSNSFGGAFINALRRFLARRGQVHKILSDQGTNFLGAQTILQSKKVACEMINKNIEWEFIPAGASHFGGVWERMIGIVRWFLEVIVGMQMLTDDSLNTLFCEIECTVNSRPLSVVSSDARDPIPISPNKLLMMCDAPILLSNNINSNYSQHRWRQVQYLADQFWLRWKKEYFLCLQKREKWLKKERNVQIGDIVLMIDMCKTRAHWPLGRVVKVTEAKDGLIRSVTVSKGRKEYIRPISKLIMILENN